MLLTIRISTDGSILVKQTRKDRNNHAHGVLKNNLKNICSKNQILSTKSTHKFLNLVNLNIGEFLIISNKKHHLCHACLDKLKLIATWVWL